MSSAGLKKLTIAHLRGAVEAVEIAFKKGSKLTLIYGENGTGKSTICDALEFLSKGRVGSLDNRGLGKTTRYWNTVTKRPADVAVTLDTYDGSCRATLGRSDVIVDPPEARPRVEVLRRTQILSLLEATPGTRYNAISRFIDVGGVEASEQTLRNLIRDLDASRNTAATRISENIDTIEQFWTTAGRPGPDALSWAMAEAQRPTLPVEPELELLRSMQAAYTRLAEHPARLAALEEALSRAEQALTAAQHHVHTRLRDATADSEALVELLRVAQDYLHSHAEQAVCPLCERPTAAEALAQRLGIRLKGFAAVRQAQEQQQQAEAHLRRLVQQRDLLAEQIAGDAAAFVKLSERAALIADLPLPASAPPTEPQGLAAWLAATAALPERWNVAEAARQDSRQFMTTLRSALQTYTENRASHASLESLVPKLQLALKTVEEERKAFTDAILGQIAAEVGRLYEQVHPGEGLNSIQLQLDDGKRASLDIAASFAGQSGPPQAYFSQSHLDTLGLCVFLALAKLDRPEEVILVLDDVVASVDEPHIERLVNMLYDEAKAFRHCIITTHYRVWREKYNWSWLGAEKSQLIELSRWSLAHGMGVVNSFPHAERLRQMLADPAPDTQTLTAKAGVLLESALNHLTLLYECPLPRRRDEHTVGDLLNAFDKKLRQALKVELLREDADGRNSNEWVPLGPILDELQKMFQARNKLGAHFNTLGHQMSDDDGLRFAEQVMALADALLDAEAGWPGKIKSGLYWSNAGDTRRLYPLRKPS